MLDEWEIRWLVGQAIRGYFEGDMTLDTMDIFPLASHIMDVLLAQTDLPLERKLGEHTGQLTEFGTPPI